MKITTTPNTKDTTMTAATATAYTTYKRTAWYLEGFHMVINAFNADGTQVGDIRALYHYKTNRLSDLTVTLLATGETGYVTVAHNDGRAAVHAAKVMLEKMLKKSVEMA